MKPHEIIEAVITSVATTEGLKWQSIMNSTELHCKEAKQVVAHLLYMNSSEAVAMEITGYSKGMIRYSSKRYYTIRDRYQHIERHLCELHKIKDLQAA